IFVEFGHAHRLEYELTEMSLACSHPQHMVDEIEIDLKADASPRNWRGGQPARGHIERYMPRVIEPWCQCQPDLADHLRPQMQRIASILPRGIRQLRPALSGRS